MIGKAMLGKQPIRFIAIRLPYPNRILNPNKRVSWQGLLAYKKTAREVGLLETYRQVNDSYQLLNVTKPLHLRVYIHPPDHRWRDDDNVIASLKPYQDGVFQALALNDRLIKTRYVQRYDRRIIKGGAIHYIIYQHYWFGVDEEPVNLLTIF